MARVTMMSVFIDDDTVYNFVADNAGIDLPDNMVLSEIAVDDGGIVVYLGDDGSDPDKDDRTG